MEREGREREGRGGREREKGEEGEKKDSFLYLWVVSIFQNK